MRLNILQVKHVANINSSFFYTRFSFALGGPHCVGANAHAFDARTSNAQGSDAHALDTCSNLADVRGTVTLLFNLCFFFWDFSVMRNALQLN